MKKLLNIFLVISLFLLPCLGYAADEGKTSQVTAEGVAAVINNDKAFARDKAISDSLRKAIEQAVGTFVQAESVVENYQLISDKILSETKGYINNYQVLQEGEDQGIYRVKIQAVVKLGALENDLAAIGLLQRKMKMPRMMIILKETNMGVESDNVENALIKAFTEKGFNFVDQEQVKKVRERDSAKLAISGDAAAAASIGLELGAEVVIAGSAVSSNAGEITPGSGMLSCQADINAKIIKTDSASILGAESAHSAAPHITATSGGAEALRKAAVSISDKLIKKVADSWSQALASGKTITLVVSKVEFDTLEALQAILKEEVRGVGDVFERSFINDVAKIDVEYKGDGKELAKDLSKRKVEGMKIKVKGYTTNTLDLELVKEQ